jgi:ABC-type multidrug transport system ATPase subunit
MMDAEIKFTHVEYSIPVADKRLCCAGTRRNRMARRFFVHRMSGSIHRGTLTLVMGPSGAGKTSLLKILARELAPTNGTVAYQRPQGSLSIAYTTSNDMLITTDTVLETLVTTATQHIAHENNSSVLNNSIAKVAEACNITACLNQRNETLSDGERRRVILANAFLMNPNIIVIDGLLDLLTRSEQHKVIPQLFSEDRSTTSLHP